MLSTSEKKRIDFLDIMRVFAFLSVLVGHKLYGYVQSFAGDLTNHSTLRDIAEIIAALCYSGGAGVIVFFLTSGYIITHVLRSESTTEFLIKRFFRIYPLYIAAVFFEIFVVSSVHKVPPPDLSILIPRLLLIGDFFNTPYALDGVEWTLRIEVMFYLFMAFLNTLGIFKRFAILPVIFAIFAVTLGSLSPIPSFSGWSDGYLTLFAPYLFMGSIIYLLENQLASRILSWTVLIFMFVYSLYLIGNIQPKLNSTRFPLIAISIFIFVWFYRSKIRCGSIIRYLSELTFAIYLFHNWLWDYIDLGLRNLKIQLIPQVLQILVVLFIFCILVCKYIEKPAISFCRTVIKNIRERKMIGVTTKDSVKKESSQGL